MRRREFLFAPLAASLLDAQSQEDAHGELSFRQVRLDFCSSELTPDAGSDFNAAELIRVLSGARVHSINASAKCHHGYAYYDTRIGVRHPSLKVDLLGELIRSSKQAGIVIHYYYSLARDAHRWRQHPEWLMVDRQGQPYTGLLCLNTPYADHVIAENQEILQKYDPSGGVMFDSIDRSPLGCFCKWCVEDREKLGLGKDLERHNALVASRFDKRIASILGNRPCTAYDRAVIDSGFDVEVRRRRPRTSNLSGLVQKTSAEMDFLNVLANGAGVQVREQPRLLPRLDAASYRRIGEVFRRIESLEPWARDARPITDIGVLSPSPTALLLELHHQFDILDEHSDLAAYRMLIVAEDSPKSPKLVAKLKEYIARGGGVLVAGAILPDSVDLGIQYAGASLYKGESMMLKPGLFSGMESNKPSLLYHQGLAIRAKPGTEVLATYGHASDDAQSTTDPLITRKGSVIFIANALFRDPQPVHREVIAELIRMLLPKQAVLATGLPRDARVTMLEQRLATGIRRVVHVLCLGVLENVQLSVRLPQHPLAVVTVPDQKPVEFVHNEFYTTFTLPRINGHQAIAFE
jgi:hypothetical protein